MTEKELQEIRERAEAACTHKTLDADKTFDFFYYDVPKLLAEVERLRNELSFIANVDMVSGAYDVEHVAVSVKCWALNALEGVNHDGK